MKTCKRCSTSKPESEFQRNAGARDGLQAYCRPCATEARRDWARRNPDRVTRITPEENRRRSRYNHMLKRGIRVTWEQFVELDAVTACQVCGSEDPGLKRPPIDHDHATGEVRGVLCNQCNRGVGMFRDDPWLLRRMADYLEAGLSGA